MAKKAAGREKRRAQSSRRSNRNRKPYVLPFQRRHYQLFTVAIAVILAGYVTMSLGSISVAPLLMVAGYCVIIPLVLMWKSEGTIDSAAEQVSSQS